jgi:carboxyl-terminal processing protease
LGFLILEVAPGGPAEEAGLQVQDLIIRVAGTDVREMDVEAVRDLVKGKEGSFVDMTVMRQGETRNFSVERRTVQTPVASWELLEHAIGLVTIENFDSRCAEESIAAIETLLEQGAEALILDVRGNPGGYKRELVKLLDYLLPEGPLFRSEDYRGKVFVDESDADCLEIPMAVLVNGDTYSAAEFFAAALDEYDAAIVVGEQTTGKGYFQSTFELDDGSAVGISIGKYTTPNGVSLADVGITPEIYVEMDEETAYLLYAGILDPADDPQIQAAAKALKAQ